MKLFKELRSVLKSLEEEKIEYALCGGLAMAVYAFPRSTLDIDLIIDKNNLGKVKDIAKKLGYTFDSGLMNFKNGKVQIHRVTKIEEGNEQPYVLDLLLVTDEIKNVWNTKKRVKWDQGELSVVSPEGLIKLKSMRESGQDKDDIKALRSIIDES